MWPEIGDAESFKEDASDDFEVVGKGDEGAEVVEDFRHGISGEDEA